jgi:hypothetical protein
MTLGWRSGRWGVQVRRRALKVCRLQTHAEGFKTVVLLSTRSRSRLRSLMIHAKIHSGYVDRCTSGAAVHAKLGGAAGPFLPRPPTHVFENFGQCVKTIIHSCPVMVEAKVAAALAQSPGSTGKQGGGRPRVISSCLTCRRRKVKCDHVHPICGSCTRGNHACTWSDQVQAPTATGRISKSTMANSGKGGRSNDVQARLDRLEYLLEKAVAGQATNPSSSLRSSAEFERKETDVSTPSSSSQTSHAAGITSDNGDGTLLLNGGQSQFVSSLHFALLADEVSRPFAIPVSAIAWTALTSAR